MSETKARLSVRLRELVAVMANDATVTCQFAPGGKLHGVGIRSMFYCQHCGQSRSWHEVAEAIPMVAIAEDILATPAGDFEHLRDGLARVLADVTAASQIADEARGLIRSRDESPQEGKV